MKRSTVSPSGPNFSKGTTSNNLRRYLSASRWKGRGVVDLCSHFGAICCYFQPRDIMSLAMLGGKAREGPSGTYYYSYLCIKWLSGVVK